ncbi:hypothetical protein [Antarcticimicrobium luteum]|uniref:Uncharacterized protein n=1 Tax=Antarcticimicrobium luteum TaxID=2547397 RepID=A0A4R5VGT7_9RHOB|nr:hypothetical protein [Antarcticimicrobium luteum]TDK51158.1 hypothetical protein E1832_04095 [Antarcticimicrobium luteum]
MAAARTRTTCALIRNAIAACRDAGIEVGAIEVMPGGGVRILPPGAIPAHRGAGGGNSCDELFGDLSD